MNHLIYHRNKYILTTQCVHVPCDLQIESQRVFCEVGTYFFKYLICMEFVFSCVSFNNQSWVDGGTSREKGKRNRRKLPI
jgi:hypothetical protein